MALNTNQALCLFYMLTLYFFTATLSPNFPALDNGTLIPIFRYVWPLQNNYIYHIKYQGSLSSFLRQGLVRQGLVRLAKILLIVMSKSTLVRKIIISSLWKYMRYMSFPRSFPPRNRIQWNHAIMIAEGQLLMAANAVWSFLWLNYSQIALPRNTYHVYILALFSCDVCPKYSLRLLFEFVHFWQY